ncbi:phenylacetyl-CoA ligase [Laetiporus sulphureus 93-53]|uniref:Phenylacetyl-CoA ligase n=1 Tax=Laetiporus sulphureus 93-53 TaxID=1314785 RepID=A0A165DWS1_9APHY|nr:phenylacetyl-CoA ligase [Laetiporus sulphureus 93-53]KZT05787.1 phenylacetyl-CoA ligase [Laetiporus sulphureus 93-53]
MIFTGAVPFNVAVPDNLTVPQLILDDLTRHPTRPRRPKDVPCLIDEDTGASISLAEMITRTDAFARAMHSIWHIGPDDVVALCAPNHIDYGIAIWAAHRLGAAVALISQSVTCSELEYQLRIVKPSLIIAHADNVHIACEAATLVNVPHSSVIVLGAQNALHQSVESADDIIERGLGMPPMDEHHLKPGEARNKIAFLLFSSGTMGKPKAVAVSHYNMICIVIQTAVFNSWNEENVPVQDRRYRPGDRCASVVPFYHTYGLVANLLFAIYGAMTIIVSSKFHYEKLLQSIERYRITHLFLVPPQHPATAKYDLSSLHYCVVAAAPLSAEVTSQFLAVLPKIQVGQLYGLTETCAITTSPTSQKVGTPGSAGQLVCGTLAKVVKPDGTLAGYNEPGELHVSGGQITLGYYGDEAATRESFVDGWFRTGDEVIIHENGDMFISDRIKELIKVKGHQVPPSELEGHLLDHPSIADAAVIGIPDDYAGEVPLAYVVLRPEVADAVRKDPDVAAQVQSSIHKHVSDAKSEYKWLKGGIEFVDSLPKSPSGKILRRLLRERAAATRVPRSRL